jgi:hypothetical protein
MRFAAALMFAGLLCGSILTAHAQRQPSPGKTAQGRSPGRIGQQRKAANVTGAVFQKWADEDVRWIITPEERAAFFKL